MNEELLNDYAKALSIKPSGRSREEIYDSIVNRIKARYGEKLTEPEVHEAARNLIAFCREMVGITQ